MHLRDLMYLRSACYAYEIERAPVNTEASKLSMATN
jgi:hypothetical protein